LILKDLAFGGCFGTSEQPVNRLPIWTGVDRNLAGGYFAFEMSGLDGFVEVSKAEN